MGGTERGIRNAEGGIRRRKEHLREGEEEETGREGDLERGRAGNGGEGRLGPNPRISLSSPPIVA